MSRIFAQSRSKYQVDIQAGNHRFVSDEPAGIGDDAGPSPFDLVLSGLVSCTIITLHMYANRKNWPLERVGMEASIRSMENQTGDGKTRSSVIDTQLTFHGPLTTEQIIRLGEIASRCPVHRTLKGEIQIQTRVANLKPGEY
jgi:putative redox protein